MSNPVIITSCRTFIENIRSVRTVTISPLFVIIRTTPALSSSVGLSNILDSELNWRKPGQRSHRIVVAATVMDSKLSCKVLKRIEGMRIVEAFLILSVAALDLSIVSGSIRTN